MNKILDFLSKYNIDMDIMDKIAFEELLNHYENQNSRDVYDEFCDITNPDLYNIIDRENKEIVEDTLKKSDFAFVDKYKILDILSHSRVAKDKLQQIENLESDIERFFEILDDIAVIM